MEGGHLVVPLRIGGFTRAVGLRKEDSVLVSTAISPCGFIPMQGAGRWDETPAPVGDTGYGIRWEDTPPAPLDGFDPRSGRGRGGAVGRGDAARRGYARRAAAVAGRVPERVLPDGGWS
ncbi:hypothetical protein Slala05_77460 [Streptomyces lavendulae subsp. lavendulae]|nr:hypothetical protein Slala05_77460 [Streptomyces lavendulae subsp. lavendulae]